MGRRKTVEIPEEALECVMSYIRDPRDRSAASLVCRQWHRVDSRTRRHVTVRFCYGATPEQLTRRFPLLESLTIKGRPRASMYGLIPQDWGGYAGRWIRHLSAGGYLSWLKSLHLRRMVIDDASVEILTAGRGCGGHSVLENLVLEKCFGFSTDALYYIAARCRNLKVLSVTESLIEERSGEWIHQLALANTTLETLDLYMTDLEMVGIRDLELIAANCPRLSTLVVANSDLLQLGGVLTRASKLKKLGGGQCSGSQESLSAYERFHLNFSGSLTSIVGLSFMTSIELSAVLPVAAKLKGLDLQYTLLDSQSLCHLISLCVNLEELEVRNVIGDEGLVVIGTTCKRLRKLRVERGADGQGLDDEKGWISVNGLSVVAEGCPLIEYMAAYVSDVCNSALETISRCCRNLTDFRLCLLDKEENLTELPLDEGIRALLIGCPRLRRFAIYLRPGGLTDVGLAYIGQFGLSLNWLLLGFAGETDKGLRDLCSGCPRLEKLEMRGCWFSEAALAREIPKLKSLRYLWVQAYDATPSGHHLSAMSRPFWNMEFCPGRLLPADMGSKDFALDGDRCLDPQVIAYCSIAGRRSDYPRSSVFPVV
ncbi:unnamed protein product [Victoria cruziana]